jgi:diaminohydroxyphosphoribosylaminopyrimidine deaminase/5-amino-6-(5-phosphoribosylamino)uracil reductase
LALGPDGSVPLGAQGQPVWATSPQARALGHLMRARADAILVGRRTVLDDDPLLTCRLPGLAGRSPRRVVLARQLDGLHRTRLALTAHEQPVWVFCGKCGDALALVAAGVRVVRVPEIGGALWLPSVMEALVAEGVTRLLVEGGPAIWRAFSDAGLVDEAVLFQARGRGGTGREGSSGAAALERYLATTNLQLSDHRTVGGDDLMVFRRHWRSLESLAQAHAS